MIKGDAFILFISSFSKSTDSWFTIHPTAITCDVIEYITQSALVLFKNLFTAHCGWSFLLGLNSKETEILFLYICQRI